MSTPEDGIEQRIKQREDQLRNGLETKPIASAIPHGNIPNTPLASSFIAFLLGSVFTLGSLLFLLGGIPGSFWLTYRLGFFVATWSLFHYLEFAVTAGWNREKCSVDSYLLDNGAMYHIANGVALTEYILTSLWKPEVKSFAYVSEIGMMMIILGQTLRSLAMIHASTNFSHAVAFGKRKDHVLVTDGVYSWFRHPSYAGFYYWALGTQCLLQNPLTFVVFLVLLWRFFYYRTRAEEKALIRFFGDEYVQYRARTWTWIPFVP